MQTNRWKLSIYSRNEDNRGFIALELAIVIAVLSLLSVPLIQKAKIQKTITQQKITQENQEIITHAIAAFLIKNNRLPRPSDTSDSGEEGTKEQGYIPFKSLGISQKNTLTGNGKCIIYAPEPQLTNDFQSIYPDTLKSNQSFCDINDNSLKFSDSTCDKSIVIAFVLLKDKQNPITLESALFWISRDLLLSKYLHIAPQLQDSSRVIH